jgi:hypothetical protein
MRHASWNLTTFRFASSCRTDLANQYLKPLGHASKASRWKQSIATLQGNARDVATQSLPEEGLPQLQRNLRMQPREPLNGILYSAQLGAVGLEPTSIELKAQCSSS